MQVTPAAPGLRASWPLETLERDEILRCLTEPGATAVGAAAMLGIGFAPRRTRKIALYDITMPRGIK